MATSDDNPKYSMIIVRSYSDSGIVFPCPYCHTVLHPMHTRTHQKAQYKGVLFKRRVLLDTKEQSYQCPECKFGFWGYWSESYLSCYVTEVIHDSDPEQIEDAIALAWATRKPYSREEKFAIWRQIQNEQPQFELLTEKQKAEIIRLTLEYGKAEIASFEFANSGIQCLYIGKDRDFGTTTLIEDPDIERFCRMRHAAEAYIDLVKRDREQEILNRVEERIHSCSER